LSLSQYQFEPTHLGLVKGVVKVNPHPQVLCPTLAARKDCRKGIQEP